MSAAVFISHSSKDRRVAERLCAELEGRGIVCWISSRDIAPGQNFQEAIVAAIRSVPVMVLIFTPNANASEEIKKEVAIASVNRVTVIPVRMMDATPSDAFLYELATRQWIDVFGDWADSIERLADHVRNSIAAKPGSPGLGAALAGPAVAFARTRRSRRGLAGVAAALICLVLVAGASWWFLAPRPPAPTQSAQLPAVVSTTAPAAAPYVDQFVGTWNNQNPQTDGITRLEITNRLGSLSIHLWGRCHPTDCDNGTHPLDIAAGGNSLSYSADFKFKLDQGSVAASGKDVLDLVVHTHFTDESRRPDYQATYRFQRG